MFLLIWMHYWLFPYCIDPVSDKVGRVSVFAGDWNYVSNLQTCDVRDNDSGVLGGAHCDPLLYGDDWCYAFGRCTADDCVCSYETFSCPIGRDAAVDDDVSKRILSKSSPSKFIEDDVFYCNYSLTDILNDYGFEGHYSEARCSRRPCHGSECPVYLGDSYVCPPYFDDSVIDSSIFCPDLRSRNSWSLDSDFYVDRFSIYINVPDGFQGYVSDYSGDVADLPVDTEITISVDGHEDSIVFLIDDYHFAKNNFGYPNVFDYW